jgi:hypothetical protein
MYWSFIGANAEWSPAERHAFTRSNLLDPTDGQIRVGAADIEEEIELSRHANHSRRKATGFFMGPNAGNNLPGNSKRSAAALL